MKYRASISMRDNRNRLKSLLNDSDNEGYIFLNAELPDCLIRISASTKQALENRIERCQASLLACGFIPMMFEIERWTE